MGSPLRRQLHHFRGSFDGTVLRGTVIDTPFPPENQEKEYSGGEDRFLGSVADVVRYLNV